MEIHTHLPPHKMEVYADKDGIVQVFTNLVSNAIKFTEKGKVEMSVADKGNAVEGCVADTGRGIPEEDLPKVFGKFQQFSRRGHVGDLLLNKIADFYDRSLGYTIRKLTTVLEPLLLGMMGRLVGFIMASMLLPIFDMVKILRH